MKRQIHNFLLFLPILLQVSCNGISQNTNCEKEDSLNYVKSSFGCIYFKYFKSDSLTVNPNLVILIHGDAPFNPPTYQYKLAKILSEHTKNTIIVAILRPGYSDSDGNHSDGTKGTMTGDNYTNEVISSITQEITELKKRYKPKKTIIAGHSGGAVISADIISLTPDLIDNSVLVSCPCDVQKWRNYMSSKQPFYRAWKDSVASISPFTIEYKLRKDANIILVHGSNDDVVPFDISEAYYQKLKESNTNAKLITMENAGHEIFLSDIVIKAIKDCLSY